MQSIFEPNSLKRNDGSTSRVTHKFVAAISTRRARFAASHCLEWVVRRQLAFISRCHYNEPINEVRPLPGNFFKPSALRWAFVFMGSSFVRAVLMRKLKHG